LKALLRRRRNFRLGRYAWWKFQIPSWDLPGTGQPLTLYRPAMPFGNRKNILEDLFSSVLSQFKKYHPSGNLKFLKLGILKSLKLRILVKEILLISLKLNFTPNGL